MRLQKLLSQVGLGSRRKMEEWIAKGCIEVNGKVALIGQVVSEKDKIAVRGKYIQNPLEKEQKTRILLYHKPVGEICSREDPKHTRSVFASLPFIKEGRWVQVGRLDIHTSGLLLFTNNGDLAHFLMHPSSAIEREYAVRVYGTLTPAAMEMLKKGVLLEDGEACFSHLEARGGEGKNTWYHVVLQEGRNREVRRMFEVAGVTVSRLIRVRFGPVSLPRFLARGCQKEYTPKEVERFLASVQWPKT